MIKILGILLISILPFVASENVEIVQEVENELNEILQEVDNELDEEPANEEDFLVIEGDVVISKSESKNGILGSRYRWPNAVIPFEIRGKYMSSELENIRKAIRSYHQNTCIHLVPRNRSHVDYISINNYNDGICSSPVGKQGGPQIVSLGKGCLYNVATPIHEIMHSAGFTHEHNRSDRDDWIDIHWENINPEQKSNFRKRLPSEYSDFGTHYNYDSVMHYPEDAFSKEEGVRKTMVPKKKHNGPIGRAKGFSKDDINKLNRMYKCKKTVQQMTGSVEPKITIKK